MLILYCIRVGCLLLRKIPTSCRKSSNFLLFFFIIIKVLLLGILSVHTPGYKNDLNCSFNQFTCVVTHPVRGIKGSDLLGLIVLQ